MINSPLTNILLKIFANGFYRAHAGLFLFIGLIMVGAIPPQNLWMYEKTLMLAFISAPIMMIVVFAIWLVYATKAAHYVNSQIFAVNQQFLFYSSNSFSKNDQIKSWAIVQFSILAPIIAYGITAVFVGISGHYYLASACILICMAVLTIAGALIYTRQVNGLLDGSNQSFLLKLSAKWHKPFYSLYTYHVFDKMKVTYIVTKVLSWLVITGVFLLFADVQHDLRVAGIAMLAIVTAHALLVYQGHVFEGQYLSFARALPYSYGIRFFNYLKNYLLLLLPEIIWLFTRFSPFTAFGLLLFGLSVLMLFHCLIYQIGLDMDKYLQWIMGAFILLFWLIMYRVLWVLVPLNLAAAYLIFYKRYYLASP